MFNVNPARMYRNKLKKGAKSHPRHFKRSPLRMKIQKVLGNMRVSLKGKDPQPRKPTHKASKKRRAKSLMKARMFGLGWIGTTTRGKEKADA